MIRILIISFIAIFLLNNSSLFPQVKIKPLAISNDLTSDSVFYDMSKTRSIRLLNKNWKAYSEDDIKNKMETTIPCFFEGSESLIFETEINLTKDEINNSIIKLGFLGINYSTEIIVNKLDIFKRLSCEIPFEIELPKDILKSDSPNIIAIKVNSKLDSENTIPTLQRFLFPKNSAGIIRDIYLKIIPMMNISDYSLTYSLDDKLLTANLNLSVVLENIKSKFDYSSSRINENLLLKVKLKPQSISGNTYNFDFAITETNGDKLTKNFQFSIPNPILWTPETPNYYVCEIGLYFRNQLIDASKREISFYSLKTTATRLLLNNLPFSLCGTTYYLDESELTRLTSHDKIRSDLTLIKTTGFNAVRFAKSYPNPYAIKLCQEMGLISFVELPINSVPEEILTKENFRITAANHFKDLVQLYSKYSSSIIFGLGSSYLQNSETTANFITYLLKNRNDNRIISYASFMGIQQNEIEGIDLYGFEIYSFEPDDLKEIILNSIAKEKPHKYFISEINYPNYYGKSTGYQVKNSAEAQAKYFESIIDLSINKKMPGFFINTLIKYKGALSSLYGGYSENNIYKIGIVNEEPKFNSPTYKLIEAKLNHKGKITIPIGTRKDENKLMFITIALGLSIFMAVLINSKKKFREDCTRALFRPYNFFADIRDHRVLSGLHTILLMLIEASAISLLFTILLYYLRTNLLFEKILLSFGEENLMALVSYFAWHPENSFIYLFLIMLIKFAVISVVIKLVALFLKTKIEFAGIFYMVVWAFFPFIILLPVELMLYKILALTSFNTFVIIFLFILFLWILHRILKGIYVLFDARRFPVFAYSFLFIIAVATGILLYYQLTNSTLYYISNAIKQYKSMSL